MTSFETPWLSETLPTPRDHLAFAQERQRLDMIERLKTKLDSLSNDDVEIVYDLLVSLEVPKTEEG